MADISKSISVAIDVQQNATSSLQSISSAIQKTANDFTSFFSTTQKAEAGVDSLSSSLNAFIATEGKVNESTQGASSGFMTLVGSMFTAQVAFTAFQSALSSIKNFVSDGITQGLEYSGTVAILTQNVKNAGLAYEQLVPQIQAYASSQIKLGFNDDDTTKSVGKLLLITGNYTQALKLNHLAMDLAANKGVSLEQATTSLAQVMQGAGGRALMQYGLSFKDGASAAEILDELQKKVAGSAEALAGSPQGAINEMSAQWNDMKQNLGTQLLPTIQILFKTFEDNLPGITKLVEAAVVPIDWLIKKLSDIGQLYSSFQELYKNNGKLDEEMDASARQNAGDNLRQNMVDAYNKAHAGAQITIADFKDVKKGQDLVKEAAKAYNDELKKNPNLKNPLASAYAGFDKQNSADALASTVDDNSKFPSNIGTAGKNATDALNEMKKQIVALGDSVDSVNQKSVKFGFDSTASFQSFIATIGNTKLSNDDFIKEAEAGFQSLSTKIQATQSDITSLTGKIVDAQTTFATFVTSTNQSAGDSMAQIVINAQKAIPDLIKQISTTSQSGGDTQDLQKQLTEKQKIVDQSKTTEFTSNAEFVKELAFLQGEQGKTELEQALDLSKQKIQNKLDETTQLIGQISVQIKADQDAHDMYVKFQNDATQVLEDNVKIRQSAIAKEASDTDILKTHVDNLTDSYNNLAKAMQRAYPTQATLFPAISSGAPHATGGGVMKNTSYLVGENGPEMFVPNTGGNIIPSGAVGGNSTNIIINNPTVRNDSDIPAITNSIMKALARQQELAKNRAYK